MIRTLSVLLVVLSLGSPLSACARTETPPTDAAAAAPSPAAEAAKTWLATNAKAEGVKALPSGVQYKVLASGPATGVQPKAGDLIKVHYEGALTDGTVFDSSYQRGAPAVMPLSDLVPAWMEAIPLMRSGDSWMLYVPPEHGYGSEGAGGVIPPDAALVFKIELVDVLPS
jgi:peptidylprolyl isomerase/FKBP-type peptidyl-prolyl cis-trans isomerase FklB